MHTYIHTYTHTHAFIVYCLFPQYCISLHAFIHTRIYKYIHAYIPAYIHACIHTYMRIHGRTYACMYVCLHIYIHIHLSIYNLTYLDTCGYCRCFAPWSVGSRPPRIWVQGYVTRALGSGFDEEAPNLEIGIHDTGHAYRLPKPLYVMPVSTGRHMLYDCCQKTATWAYSFCSAYVFVRSPRTIHAMIRRTGGATSEDGSVSSGP